MRYAIRSVGLAATIALAFFALTAAGANAENALVVEGKVLPKGQQVELEATGSEYTSLIPDLGITLECGYAEIHGVVENQGPEEELKAVGEGVVTAHECVVVENSFCTVSSPGQEAGVVEGSAGGISVRSIGSNRYIEGSASALIEHSGVFCTLPEEVEIVGSAAGKIVEPFEEAVKHTVVDVTDEEEETLGVAVFYGSDPLYIDSGVATGHLVGEYEGQSFSVN